MTLSPRELNEWRARDPRVALVDVRDEEEFDDGYIPGCIHIPLEALRHYAPMLLPEQDRPIVVYCATGKRSLFAAETLESLGYTQVAHLAGGFEAYERESG